MGCYCSHFDNDKVYLSNFGKEMSHILALAVTIVKLYQLYCQKDYPTYHSDLFKNF